MQLCRSAGSISLSEIHINVTTKTQNILGTDPDTVCSLRCAAMRFNIWKGLPGLGDGFLRLHNHPFRGIYYA